MSGSFVFVWILVKRRGFTRYVLGPEYCERADGEAPHATDNRCLCAKDSQAESDVVTEQEREVSGSMKRVFHEAFFERFGFVVFGTLMRLPLTSNARSVPIASASGTSVSATSFIAE